MTETEFLSIVQPLCQDDPSFAPHLKRYLLTWRALGSTILDERNWPLIDVGGWSPFLAAVRAAVPCDAILSTDEAELRVDPGSPLPGCERQSAGAVLCLEVLEHMHDVATETEANRHHFTYSGMSRLLRACFETLRPGGRLFLTTPNACSLASVWRLARGQDPFMYPPHVRELAPSVLASLLRQQGFERVAVDSHDVWDRHGLSESAARSCRFVAGFDPNCPRGDDLFAWAFRPEGAP